jgi:hypothetical protein
MAGRLSRAMGGGINANFQISLNRREPDISKMEPKPGNLPVNGAAARALIATISAFSALDHWMKPIT